VQTFCGNQDFFFLGQPPSPPSRICSPIFFQVPRGPFAVFPRGGIIGDGRR
jgi:hypothetical protein